MDILEFLIINSFIVIPIYITFLVSCLLFVLIKIVKFYFDIDRLLNKIRNLSKDIDNNYKIMSEESYNIIKNQKETLTNMIDIRKRLENYFEALKSISIRKESTKSTDNVDKIKKWKQYI